MELRFSLSGLEAAASRFWASAGDAKVFAFHGEMGAGKTTFISALCRSKGSADAASSPTFSIINEYAYGENSAETIYHIDLYRLNSAIEAVQAGVEDCVNSGSLCLVEWPEKAPDLFDSSTVHVFIEPLSETERVVTTR